MFSIRNIRSSTRREKAALLSFRSGTVSRSRLHQTANRADLSRRYSSPGTPVCGWSVAHGSTSSHFPVRTLVDETLRPSSLSGSRLPEVMSDDVCTKQPNGFFVEVPSGPLRGPAYRTAPEVQACRAGLIHGIRDAHDSELASFGRDFCAGRASRSFFEVAPPPFTYPSSPHMAAWDGGDPISQLPTIVSPRRSFHRAGCSSSRAQACGR